MSHEAIHLGDAAGRIVGTFTRFQLKFRNERSSQVRILNSTIAICRFIHPIYRLLRVPMRTKEVSK